MEGEIEETEGKLCWFAENQWTNIREMAKMAGVPEEDVIGYCMAIGREVMDSQNRGNQYVEVPNSDCNIFRGYERLLHYKVNFSKNQTQRRSF